MGLLCCGVLLEWFSWRSAFAVNVVLAIIALAGTFRFVPESSEADAPALDKGGALLAMVGLVALVFSIIEAPDAGWASARTLGGLAAGMVALAGFVLYELHQEHPLLDPRLFTNRRLSAGSLSICIQFFAFFGFTFVSLQYLEGVRGYSPLVAAFFSPLTLLPSWLGRGIWMAISIGAYIGSLAWALRVKPWAWFKRSLHQSSTDKLSPFRNFLVVIYNS